MIGLLRLTYTNLQSPFIQTHIFCYNRNCHRDSLLASPEDCNYLGHNWFDKQIAVPTSYNNSVSGSCYPVCRQSSKLTVWAQSQLMSNTLHTPDTN